MDVIFKSSTLKLLFILKEKLLSELTFICSFFKKSELILIKSKYVIKLILLFFDLRSPSISKLLFTFLIFKFYSYSLIKSINLLMSFSFDKTDICENGLLFFKYSKGMKSDLINSKSIFF